MRHASNPVDPPLPTRVRVGEWGWVLVWAVVILVLSSVPYLICGLAQTETFRFGGLVYDVGDIYTYLAEMRQGARGYWLLHLPFTSEAHPRALIHPLYLLLGKLGLPALTTYQIARLAAGLFLLLSIYAFLAYFTRRVPLRRLAFLLTGFSSGLGWLILVLAGDLWLGAMPIDFWVPEAYTLPIVYGFPHISLSVALLLWALLAYLRATEGGSLRWACAGGLLTLLLVFLVPFDIAIVWGAIGAYILARLLRERRMPWPALRAGALVAAVSVPGLAYNFWVFSAIPAFREWSRQNEGLSPHPLHFVVSFAFLGLLALPAGLRAVRRWPSRWLLPVAWVLADLVLVYLPFNLQRRLIAGLHPALCLLAAIGLTTILAPAVLHWTPLRRALTHSRRYSRSGLRRLFFTAALLFTLPSNLLLLAGPMLQSPAHPEPLFQSQDKVEAVAWLAAHTPAESVVLCAERSGNYIPAHADNWVYLGHGAITSDFARKASEVERLFAGGLPEGELAAFLHRNRIAYIYQGPDEHALGSAELSDYPFLQPVFANSTVRIFAVVEG